jgi:cob(I)alamin adenosyltransferase
MSDTAKGLVYVFTGEGKGKTSAAIGVGVRAALSGMKVAMVSWYKESSWPISEKEIPKKLKNFKLYLMGRGFHIKDLKFKNKDLRIKRAPVVGGGFVVDDDQPFDHKKAAREALSQAQRLIGKVEVLILDEVTHAILDKFITATELVELLKRRGKTHVVVTGRKAPMALIHMADLVTEMKKVKHPYDRGVKAVKGLDF